MHYQREKRKALVYLIWKWIMKTFTVCVLSPSVSKPLLLADRQSTCSCMRQKNVGGNQPCYQPLNYSHMTAHCRMRMGSGWKRPFHSVWMSEIISAASSQGSEQSLHCLCASGKYCTTITLLHFTGSLLTNTDSLKQHYIAVWEAAITD